MLRPLRCFAGPAVAAALLSVSTDALAATYRYSSSSNRIYVENGGTATLSAIKAAVPSAPLDLVDSTNKIWLLRANLIVEDGSVLLLNGSGAGGDVDELRLKSDGSGYVMISAEVGAIDIRATRIQSWDAAAGGPDSEYATGRAFIRVRSKLAADGTTPLESRMDIHDSEIGYLGFDASESYGLSWKVIGSGTGLFDKVNVYGDIVGSHIHHNYFGVYSYGAEGGQWLDNHVHDNVGYGFDPHDDSDHLVIEGNDVHDNGSHGIIASKRCDHLVLRGNKSYANVGNGIMLHRSSDDALLENNESYLNGDSGIALYAGARTVVRGNKALDNRNAGIRLSMGEEDSVIENNELGFNKYGFLLYRGNDEPNPGSDARPKRNVFRNNTVHDSSGAPLQLDDSDSISFIDNVFQTNAPYLTFRTGTANLFKGNTIPSTAVVRIAGSSSVPTEVAFSSQTRVQLQIDNEFGTARFTESSGYIFDPDEAVYTVATTSASTLRLTSAAIGSSSTVYRRSFKARTSSGSVEVNPTLWNTGGDRSKAWDVKAPSSTVSVTYTVGNLAPGLTYEVALAGTPIGSFIANSSGQIVFTHAPGTTSTVRYTVKLQ